MAMKMRLALILINVIGKRESILALVSGETVSSKNQTTRYLSLLVRTAEDRTQRLSRSNRPRSITSLASASQLKVCLQTEEAQEIHPWGQIKV